MLNKTEETASRHLGRKTGASETYDPSLLVAVPRCENRLQYNIDNENLPFEGWDIWHAYEFSSMTQNGLPITRLLKIKYNCNSDYIVESKSLKLYLNSFNMTRLGASAPQCLEICKRRIEKDLSEKLLTKVSTDFIENNVQRYELFENFENLTDYIDEKTFKIDRFKEAPELLKTEKKDTTTAHFLMFDSLRSNCRVTHQPDFADVFIYYKSMTQIDESSLVKYLCSFRSEFHFHEECCEMIYKRLYDLLDEEDKLFVCALYTRRGGIDICPVRQSKNCGGVDISNLLDTAKFARKGIKQ